MPHLDQTPDGFALSMPVESGSVTLDVTFPVSSESARVVQSDPVRIWLLYAAVHVLAHAAQHENAWPAFKKDLPMLSEIILLGPLPAAKDQLRAIDAERPRAGLRYMIGLLSQGAVTVDDAWQLGGSAFGAG